MFLIRAAFWLSIVIFLIPADPQSGADAPRVTVVETLVAARATIDDLSAFCERNPDVCVTGGAAFRLFADKAENGVRMLYEYFDGGSGETEAPAEATSGTLSHEDTLPVWRGPAGDKAA
jgi:hypothetical protein